MCVVHSVHKNAGRKRGREWELQCDYLRINEQAYFVDSMWDYEGEMRNRIAAHSSTVGSIPLRVSNTLMSLLLRLHSTNVQISIKDVYFFLFLFFYFH